MDTRRDRQPACGFCEGTGLWTDADGSLPDPCPLCEGSGAAPSTTTAADDTPPEAVPLARLLAVLPRLTQAERQRLYEELHGRYDCRIYRI